MISTYWESGNSRLIAYNSFVNMLPLKKKDYLTEWENLLKIKSEKMKNGGSRMKLIELKIRNFGCIDEKGIRIKIDNIVVLIGPNNVGNYK